MGLTLLVSSLYQYVLFPIPEFLVLYLHGYGTLVWIFQLTC
jgi:nitrate reductase NapE component